MARDVFISHSAHDKSLAEEICKALENSSLTCWIAPRDLRPGRAFPTEITRAIQRCRAMVVIISNQANSSPQVLSEVQLAVNCEVPTIAFAIEEVTEFGVLQYNLHGAMCIEASTPPLSEDVARLQLAVKKLLDQSEDDVDKGMIPRIQASSGPNPTQGKCEIRARHRSRVFSYLISALVIVVPAAVVLHFLLNGCLDTSLSKLIPDSLTTALVLIALAIVATPYLAGQDVGPLKVPKVSERSARHLRIGGPLLFITLLVILFVPLRLLLWHECDKIKNGSAEDGDIAWNAARWTGAGDGKMEIATDQVHRGAKSFKISTSEPHHLRWVQPLRLEPNANYLLTAWVRTQDVAHSQPGDAFDRGANAAIQFMSPGQFPEHSEAVIGTNEWRQLSLRFATKELIDIEVQLQLGGYGAITTGTVWFDDVRLKRLAW